MKSVLISIQPKWCELIASGKKTVEVRKTRPKIETPFKVYIYCTKAKEYFSIGGGIYAASDELYRTPEGEIKFGDSFELAACEIGQYDETNFLNGKVIGEFVCGNIDRIAHCGACNNDIRLNIVDKNLYCKELSYDYLSKCKLSYYDIDEYSNGYDVYGWHISNLVIYDKPKELSEFKTVDKDALKQCKYRERVYQNPDYANGAWLFGGYVCNKGEIDWCCDCKRKPLTRPPQSWCYVEKGGGSDA